MKFGRKSRTSSSSSSSSSSFSSDSEEQQSPYADHEVFDPEADMVLESSSQNGSMVTPSAESEQPVAEAERDYLHGSNFNPSPDSEMVIDEPTSQADLNISAHADEVDHSSSSSESEEDVSFHSDKDEDPPGNSGNYSVNPSESHDDTTTKGISSSSDSEEGPQDAIRDIKAPSSPKRKDSTSSSNSSSSDENEANDELREREADINLTHEGVDEDEKIHPRKEEDIFPVVLDTSSSDSEEDNSPIHEREEGGIDGIRAPIIVDKSPSPVLSEKVDDDKDTILHEVEKIPSDRDSSSSSSSSESDMEEESNDPLVIQQSETELTPLSLKKALEERERELELRRQEQERVAELGARKPSEPDQTTEPFTEEYMESYSPEAFDFNGDPSLRARTAYDFDGDLPREVPPKLPPKQRSSNAITAPDIGVHRHMHRDPMTDRQSGNVQPPILHVKEKTASLGQGMWSDDGDESEYSLKRMSLPSRHPPADRIIDFSNNSNGDHSLKRSRSRNKSARKKGSSGQRSKDKYSRSRSPSGSRSGHRVIDFQGRPYEDPHNAINRQVMVSLQANTYDTDAYDSVQETGDELNKLIEKANSLGYHHNYPSQGEDVFHRRKLPEKNLESKHQDAFAKIVAPLPVQPHRSQTQYRPQVQSDHPSSDNSKRSSRSLSRKKRKPSPPVEAVDGDDEISLADSEINRFKSPSPPPFEPEPALAFTTEIYPSDYTEFESFSEAEYQDMNRSLNRGSSLQRNPIPEIYNPALQTAGESAYDTVPDNDLETDIDIPSKGKLNPIVNSNFQICSDLSGSKSFPARLRENKPQKGRPGLEHLAIPLNQASKKRSQYPTSLPYFGNDLTEDDELDALPRRTGSVDDIPGIYPIINPSIIVQRQATHPKGYRPVVAQELMVQSSAIEAPPLPEKKEKKKKEKKPKKETPEKTVPQINLKVEPAEGDSSIQNNNLQINLLPSNDPNVINLNIRSASVNPEPQSLPVITTHPQLLPAQIPAPVTQSQPTAPAATMDNQHRVVEVTSPPLVITGDDISDPAVPYSSAGGVMLAGGVPTEILPNPILATAAQQYGSSHPPYPTVSLTAPEPARTPALPLPTTQPLAQTTPPHHAPVMQQPVSSAPLQQQPPLQYNNEPTVVDVHSPWPLPEDRNSAKESNRMHRGDSGIDLSMHDRNRQPRSRASSKSRRRRSASRSTHRDSSSSYESVSRHRKRPSSQKKLRSNDYLSRLTPSSEYLEWYREKYLKPSCCYLFTKHLMFFINLLFTLAGLALVGFGIWGMVDLHQKGFTDPGVIFMDPLFAVMVAGFIITLVAFHGAAGFIRDNICMLKCFGSFLVILFIIFVIGGIVFWAMMTSVTDFTVSTYTSLIKQYDHETRVGLSYSIDIMQNTFECCGISHPGASQWQNNKSYKCRSDGKCHLPKSCCRESSNENFVCLSTSNMRHDKACIDSMSTAVKNYTPIIVGVWVGIWALMMIELICIYFMCKEIAYLQKIRNFLDDPVRVMKKRQKLAARSDSEESTDEPSDESDSETSTSEDEYRKKRSRKKREKNQREKKSKKKRKDLGKRTTSKHSRRGSYHVNRSFSIKDERSSTRGRRGRGGQRDSSRSRGRRGSY